MWRVPRRALIVELVRHLSNNVGLRLLVSATERDLPEHDRGSRW
jgi:hypothetical protein